MKQTALEYLIEFAIDKLNSLSDHLKGMIIQSTTCETWEEVINDVRQNKNDFVEWVFAECFAGTVDRSLDIFPDLESETNLLDEMVYIYHIDGRNIRFKYSDYSSFVWKNIEYDFVEQVEVMVPTLIWQKVQ